MPSSLLFTSFLLISQVTMNARAARVPGIPGTWKITVNDLQQQQHGDCEFEVDGYGFDLCPLMHKINLIEGRGLIASEEIIRGEGPSAGRRFYEIALGGSRYSNNEPRSSSEYLGTSCMEGTWVCMLDMGYIEIENGEATNNEFVRKPIQATAISGKSKSCKTQSGRSIISSLTVDKDDNDNPLSLKMSLHGGEEKAIQAEITLLCNDIEYLRYRGDDEGVHSFSWATPHGCPVRLLQPKPSSDFAIMQDPVPEGEDKEPGDSEGGDDELLPQDNSRARRRIAMIVVAIILCLALTFVLATSARARQFANEKARGATYAAAPFLSTVSAQLYSVGQTIHRFTAGTVARVNSPFRQSGNRLVSWAQEDMSLLEAEDVMVNGSDAYDHLGAQGLDWDADGLDEYIPLTSSPRYGQTRREVRSYGSTPEVETFAERGVTHGLGKFFRK